MTVSTLKPTPVVAVRSLCFRWPEQPVSLLDIEEFHLSPAERVFLRGASGCGKSTLLGLIAGVLRAQSGQIEVLGHAFGNMSGAARDRFRADHFGIIFQQFNLIPYLNVIENVTLPCHFSARRARKARARGHSMQREALRLLKHLDMDDKASIDKPVTELSVGQQQRVAAARALIGSPEILIADEPTSSMDVDRRQAFVDLLFRECAETGASLLFVSHDGGLRATFDRALEFERINGNGNAWQSGVLEAN